MTRLMNESIRLLYVVPTTLFLLFSGMFPLHADVPVPLGTPLVISKEAGDASLSGKPAIASDGTNFLIVWRDGRNFNTNNWDIYGARISHDGKLLDPEGIAISTFKNVDRVPESQYVPSVTFDGTNFIVVWNGNRTGVEGYYRLVAARVSPDGMVLDPNGVEITTGNVSPQRMPSIAFDGENCLVTWRTAGSEIRAARITSNIENLDGEDGFFIGTGFYPYVAFDGTNYMVTWSNWGDNGTDIFGAIVSRDGMVLSPGVFTISSAPADEGITSIAFDGTNYFTVWYSTEKGNVYNGSIYGARISTSGAVLDNPAIKIENYCFGQASPIVIFDGTAFFVMWHVEQTPADFRLKDLFGRYVSSNGEVSSAQTTTPIATFFWHQGWTMAFSYDNNRFIAAWNQGRSEEGFVIYCRLLQRQPLNFPAPIGSPRGPADTGWTLSVSSRPAFHGIWGYNDETIYAVGEAPYLYKFDGDQWHDINITNTLGRFGIWGFDANDVWGSGWSGQIANLNGNDFLSWYGISCEGVPAGALYAIWGITSDDIFVAGQDGKILRRHDRSPDWECMESNAFVDLYDIWGTDSNNIYVVGVEGTVRHFNGDTWSRMKDVPSIQSLNGIWGSGPNDIFIVGDFGTILHFDGTVWSVHNSGTNERLSDVFGLSPSNVYAVGANGTILSYDGVNWTREQSNTIQSLEGVWGTSKNIWVVGDNGVILRKMDSDGDGTGDIIDSDDDNDGLPDDIDNFPFAPIIKGDINNDGSVDLMDTILLFQILVEIEPPQPVFNEANIAATVDNKIGIKEIIFILQHVSGLR